MAWFRRDSLARAAHETLHEPAGEALGSALGFHVRQPVRSAVNTIELHPLATTAQSAASAAPRGVSGF
jgi:hypothetical protein